MKRTFILLVIALSFNTISAQNNIIKANLFSPIVRTGSFFFERNISEKTSGQIGFFYTGFSVDETKFSGIGITPEFRFYPSGNAPSGFYVAPFLRYQSFSLSADDIDPNTQETIEAKATLTTFGAGLLVGRQWIFGETISLDIFAGPCLNSGSTKVEAGNETIFSTGSFEGFGVRTGLTLGLAF